jgi:hypothetical protein
MRSKDSRFLGFGIFGRTPRTGDRPVIRPLPTYGIAKQEKRRHISIPKVASEPTIPVLDLLKTVCASDRAAKESGYAFVIPKIPSCGNQTKLYEHAQKKYKNYKGT